MLETILDNPTKKRLRRIAHHLDPVILVGEGGVSDPVIAETNRALTDHELIKVKIHSEDRGDRKLLGAALAEACEAEVLQRIGKVVVLYRENPTPNPALSNVLRAAKAS